MSFTTSDFRRILGHYPTGVCAITSFVDDVPVGVIVGSFSSVSLDPPLVGFFPGKDSTTWPKINKAVRFCVNVLAGHQAEVCRALSSKAEDKFQSISHRLSDSGLPVLDDIVAWIDCHLESVHDAGDRLLVLGRVKALAAEYETAPLLFLRGGYGRFA